MIVLHYYLLIFQDLSFKQLIKFVIFHKLFLIFKFVFLIITIFLPYSVQQSHTHILLFFINLISILNLLSISQPQIIIYVMLIFNYINLLFTFIYGITVKIIIRIILKFDWHPILTFFYYSYICLIYSTFVKIIY